MLVIGVLVFCIQLFPYLLKAGKQLLPLTRKIYKYEPDKI